MESSEDIRDKSDLSLHEARIITTLQVQLPPTTPVDDVGYKVQGLDCLIALVKCFYSNMPSLYFTRDEQNRDFEAKNPILGLAWLKVDYEHGQVSAEWTEAKKAILMQFNPKHPDDAQLRFEQLFHTRLMKNTLWFRPEYRLHRASLIKSETNWKLEDLGNEEIFKLSTLVFDRSKSPTESFERTIEDAFGLRQLSDGSRRLRMCAEPCVLRIQYTTKKGLQSIPFSRIKNVYLPIHELKDSEPVVLRNSLYTLVAVVSLTDDRLRTYSFLGRAIFHWPKSPIVSGKTWSLEDDADGRFMLFYMLAGKAKKDVMYGEFGENSLDWKGYEIADEMLMKRLAKMKSEGKTGKLGRLRDS
ncbi:hypothetical protein FSARC_13882 [Fusarium sarcochroum]|uniref:Uncharacterized protein n=1 Tax=Fusarium sarcochroum TaxID=1208366 RepID=A0A8H4SY95_9HYPO|nr:hypothetical protein FSARC_13882 [Fusarium sarcochroum]